MKKHTYKIVIGFVLLILIFFNLLPVINSGKDAKANTLQKGIAEDIIRLHIVANSDLMEDQQLKMRVKDAIVAEFGPMFSETEDITEARQEIKKVLPQIESVARNVLLEEGKNYTIKASLGTDYFPVKSYGKYTLPCGYYEALRIELGDACGQNWWCIMFPPLCFVDSTYTLIPEDTDLRMKQILTETEYSEIVNKNVKVTYKFKLWEYLKNIFG